MKILHLPTPVGGNSWGLSRGERQLGLQSDVLYTSNSWINYPADRILFNTVEKRSNTLKDRLKNNIITKPSKVITLLHEIQRIRREYDVFHFNFGSSLLDTNRFGLSLLDLPLYSSRGKIIVTYNGCDARQKYPTMARTPFSACHDSNCYDGICIDRKHDQLKEDKIKKFNKYADAIFALNPDLLHFLPKRAQFLPYTIANWNTIQTVPEKDVYGDTITIVHAPTNRGAKGTDIILKTLERIQSIYKKRVKIILVENLPYSEAIKKYAEADLIIDQILIGWYGAFAVEAMKMGKPVVAYVREDDLSFIPSQMVEDCNKSIINADPCTLYDVLESIIQDPDVLKSYRNRGLTYVNRWHDPVSVAQITKKAYEE